MRYAHGRCWPGASPATARASTRTCTGSCSRSTRCSSAPGATSSTRPSSTCGSTSTCRSPSCCSPRSRSTWSRSSSTGSAMKILITTKAGRQQTRKTVNSDWLRVGRNTSCEIHLPDPRVPLEQGMIVYRDGLVYMEGESGSQVITRRSVRSERMHYGEPVEVGPYRIQMTPPPPGYDAALRVELVHPLEATPALAARASELTLGSLGLTKRWAAWLWALAVIFIFLVVPMGRVLDLPWRGAAQSALFGDRFWNPGPVSLAHQPI